MSRRHSCPGVNPYARTATALGQRSRITDSRFLQTHEDNKDSKRSTSVNIYSMGSSSLSPSMVGLSGILEVLFECKRQTKRMVEVFAGQAAGVSSAVL